MALLTVMDTNVLLSGLRSRNGRSYQVLARIGGGDFQLVLTVPLVLEYEKVLKEHHEATGLTESDVNDVLDYLCSTAKLSDVHYLWRPLLRDPNDDHLLEAAVAGGADVLLTFYRRHFAEATTFGIAVMDPATFLGRLGGTT